jgi:hypothetical protein
MSADGKKNTVRINEQGGTTMNYEPNALNVKVEAGVNFAIQKARALQQITAVMQASQMFAQFINSKGLRVLVDNMEIKDADQLKEMADEFMLEMKKQQANQPNPVMMKMQLEQQKLQMQGQKDQSDTQIKQEQNQIAAQDVQNDTMRLILDAKQADDEQTVQLAKAATEREVHGVNTAMDMHDMQHRHAKETLETMHAIEQSDNQKPGVNE